MKYCFWRKKGREGRGEGRLYTPLPKYLKEILIICDIMGKQQLISIDESVSETMRNLLIGDVVIGILKETAELKKGNGPRTYVNTPKVVDTAKRIFSGIYAESMDRFIALVPVLHERYPGEYSQGELGGYLVHLDAVKSMEGYHRPR